VTSGVRALALNSPTDFQIPPPAVASRTDVGYGSLKALYQANPGNASFIEFPNLIHFMSPYGNTAPLAPTSRVCSGYLAEIFAFVTDTPRPSSDTCVTISFYSATAFAGSQALSPVLGLLALLMFIC
jgi:hypothetical protein